MMLKNGNVHSSFVSSFRHLRIMRTGIKKNKVYVVTHESICFFHLVISAISCTVSLTVGSGKVDMLLRNYFLRFVFSEAVR